MDRIDNDLIFVSYNKYNVKIRLWLVLLFSVAFGPAGSNEFDIADPSVHNMKHDLKTVEYEWKYRDEYE